MKDLGYTLTQDRFELIEKPGNMVCNTLLEIPVKNASTPLSAIHMQGEFEANCNLYFAATNRCDTLHSAFKKYKLPEIQFSETECDKLLPGNS